MSKVLIISEKPSVATDLARVLGKSLGKFKKDDASGSYQNDGYIISSAVGHLLEQKKPQTEAGKSLPWKLEYLPAMPSRMELEPISKSADRLRKLLKLARSKDVTSIVNACDAGREGELIFRNIIQYGKIKKPMQRLWMQSMTDDAIFDSWGKLMSDESMLNLADAAVCRAESDWLVGLNSTRALTILQSAAGGFNVTPAGRVQTPTLAILAARQREILAFIPEPYHEVRARFKAAAGSYDSKWYDPKWKKDENRPLGSKDRIWDAERAALIAARCEGKTAIVEEKRKPVSQQAPLLFDLTSLQKEASNRFGFSARRTLQLAQECYEKHKVLTYPRTDAKFLPDDYIKTVYRTVGDLQTGLPEFAAAATDILDNKRIKASKRIFDSSKVSDHFAIIPTGRVVNLIGDVEKIFTLVVQRFLGVFLPPAEYEDTERISIIKHVDAEDRFATHGRVLKQAGWRILYTNSSRAKKEELCAVTQGEQVDVESIENREEMTKPPASYTEATLLSAMENAGKLIEDEELSSAMKERGLGTPATRASIIEGLITQEYIARDGKDLISTRRGMDLIELMRSIGLSTLSSPELTGDWEYRLKQMEQGRLERKVFMKDVREYTTEIVDCVRNFMQNSDKEDLEIACPSCEVVGLANRIDSVSCRSCKFRLRRVQSGLGLSDELMSQLITTRELPIMEGFRSRFGKPFKAGLRIVQGPRVWKAEFYFEDELTGKPVDADAVSIGALTVKDQGEMEAFETEKQWTIPEFVREGSTRKGFTLARLILGKAIEMSNLEHIIRDGKSELITGFVSQRTRRAFDAFLVLDPAKGNVSFEFPPREPRGKDGAKSSASSRFTKADAAAVDLTSAIKHGVLVIKGKGEHELLESEQAWHVPSLIYGKNRKPLAIPKEMCEVQLAAPTVQRLLSKGKSELIKEFVSRKTGKNFEAFLTFSSSNGKVGYEFPERE